MEEVKALYSDDESHRSRTFCLWCICWLTVCTGLFVAMGLVGTQCGEWWWTPLVAAGTVGFAWLLFRLDSSRFILHTHDFQFVVDPRTQAVALHVYLYAHFVEKRDEPPECIVFSLHDYDFVVERTFRCWCNCCRPFYALNAVHKLTQYQRRVVDFHPRVPELYNWISSVKKRIQVK